MYLELGIDSPILMLVLEENEISFGILFYIHKLLFYISQIIK